MIDHRIYYILPWQCHHYDHWMECITTFLYQTKLRKKARCTLHGNASLWSFKRECIATVPNRTILRTKPWFPQRFNKNQTWQTGLWTEEIIVTYTLKYSTSHFHLRNHHSFYTSFWFKSTDATLHSDELSTLNQMNDTNIGTSSRQRHIGNKVSHVLWSKAS